MRAIDTNVIVRLTARDDDLQTAEADALLDEPFIILPTVLMEAVWVLASRYQMKRETIVLHLRTLVGNGQAMLVSGGAIRFALDAFEQGHDFADALHIALAEEADAACFATFDRRLGRLSAPPIPVELLS